MKRIDNLNNEQLAEDDISKELDRRFKKMNTEIDQKWFKEISGGPLDVIGTDKIDEQIRAIEDSIEEDELEERDPLEGFVEETYEEKVYEEKKLRNNGREVGKVRVYNKGLKRTLLAISFIVVGGCAFLAGKSSAKKPIYQVCYNTLSESYFEEPTYNGVLYTVQTGDSLSSIIAHYEGDPNKQATLLDQIMSFNKLKNSGIKSGDQICLFGVPSSKLEEYGYTDNFNYFDPSVEISIRFEFLDKVVASGDVPDEENWFIESVQDLKEWYQQFKYSYVPGNDSELDEIMNEIRELCEDAKKFGYDFDFNKKAMPLSEATNYKKDERTNS